MVQVFDWNALWQAIDLLPNLKHFSIFSNSSIKKLNENFAFMKRLNKFFIGAILYTCKFFLSNLVFCPSVLCKRQHDCTISEEKAAYNTTCIYASHDVILDYVELVES